MELNNETNLSKQLEYVLNENIKLKQENIELKQQIKTQKDWNGIRNGIILPRFQKKYGFSGKNLMTDVITSIGEIVKRYLGISRLSRINEANYEQAKSIAIALTDTFLSFEWEYLKKMQIYYDKMDARSL